MAHALVLTASSSGRTSLPSDAGFALDVDGEGTVTLDVWPYPSAWVPDDIRLFRDGQQISESPGDDNLRWVLHGADRFGEFTAMAFAAGRAVTSPTLLVRPAGVPSAVPGAAASGASAQPGAGTGQRHSAATVARSGADAGTPTPDRFIDLSGTSPLRGPAEVQASSDTSNAAPASSPTPPRAGPTPTGRIPAHASPDDVRALAEVPAGEFDGRFAAWVGALFAVLALGFAGLVVTRLLIDVDLPVAEPPSDPATALTSHDGTVAERVGLASSVLLIALGGVLLLAGAALAALEVRGRQRRAPSTPTAWRAHDPGLRVLPAVLDRVNQIPGVIAVLVVGGIVLGLGLIGTLYWPTLF